MTLEGPHGEPGSAAPSRSAADDPNRPSSTKEQRETENRTCIGGMRNPWVAGRALPKIRQVGRQIWRIIEKFIDKHGEAVLKLYEELGKESPKPSEGEDPRPEGTDPELLEELRQSIARWLEVDDWGEVQVTPPGYKN